MFTPLAYTAGRQRLTHLVVLVALLFTALVALAPSPASAGTLMTLRGSTWAYATIEAYNGSNVKVATATADSAGRFAIVVPRGNYYYLFGKIVIGNYCGTGRTLYYGSTNWFVLDYSTPNPSYIDVPLTKAYRLC